VTLKPLSQLNFEEHDFDYNFIRVWSERGVLRYVEVHEVTFLISVLCVCVCVCDKGTFFLSTPWGRIRGNGVTAAFILNVSARWRLASNFSARPHAAGALWRREESNTPSVNRTRDIQSISWSENRLLYRASAVLSVV